MKDMHQVFPCGVWMDGWIWSFNCQKGKKNPTEKYFPTFMHNVPPF